VITTGAYAEGDGINVFSILAERSMGRFVLYATTFLACLVAFASLHINITGFSRMLFAQARDGRLPQYLGYLSKNQVPIASLLTIFALFLLVFFLVTQFKVNLGFLIKWPSTVFIFAYIATMAFGVKMLENRSARLFALFGCLLCSTALISSGYLIFFRCFYF
jgi:amino acid efflux transporter